MSNIDIRLRAALSLFKQCVVILSCLSFAVRLLSVYDEIHLSVKIGAEFWILLSSGRLSQLHKFPFHCLHYYHNMDHP